MKKFILAALLIFGTASFSTAKDDASPLLHPELARLKAPPVFKVRVETTRGDFIIEVHRDWAPQGADRFYNLVKLGYYRDAKFFRVIRSPRPFMAQFGMHADPAVNTAWQHATIPDDEVRQSNTRGMVTFAKSNAPNSRTTQIFINYGNNSRLDRMGFAPFGKVISGMDIVDALYAGYGEGAPSGSGPNQGLIARQGNSYLEKEFPKLDGIKGMSLVPGDDTDTADEKTPKKTSK